MNIVMYTRTVPPCPMCNQAKSLAKSKNLDFKAIDIGTEISIDEFKEKFPTSKTVPVILIDDKVIGGFTEFRNYISSKELGELSL